MRSVPAASKSSRVHLDLLFLIIFEPMFDSARAWDDPVQALQRVDVERQHFPVDADLLERILPGLGLGGEQQHGAPT